MPIFFALILLFSACRRECDNTIQVNNQDQYYYYAYVMDSSFNFHLYPDKYQLIELPPNKITTIDLGGNLEKGGINIKFTFFTDTFSKDSYLRTCNQQTKIIDRY